MKRFVPSPYSDQCRYWCKQLKMSMLRLINAQQAGDMQLKLTYGQVPRQSYQVLLLKRSVIS